MKRIGKNKTVEDMSNSVFDTEKIEKRMLELKGMPPFAPQKHEMRFSATQLFSTGNDTAAYKEVTLKFVLREGEMLFYGSSEKEVYPNSKNYKP